MANGNTALTATPTPQSPSLIRTMAENYGVDAAKLQGTLIKTIFPQDREASAEQVIMFLVVANKYDLNPFTKEIYAFPTKGGGIVPIVSIDGWLAIINRQPALDGVEFIDSLSADGKEIVSITCRIFRKDRTHPTEVTEYMDECYRETRNRDGKLIEDSPWNKWPRRMLRHKSLIQCARVAFSLSGIYDHDEAERIIEADAPRFTPGPALPVDIKRASELVVPKIAQPESETVAKAQAELEQRRQEPHVDAPATTEALTEHGMKLDFGNIVG